MQSGDFTQMSVNDLLPIVYFAAVVIVLITFFKIDE